MHFILKGQNDLFHFQFYAVFILNFLQARFELTGYVKARVSKTKHFSKPDILKKTIEHLRV